MLSACQQENKFKILPPGPINHHLIVAAKTPMSVKARGFAGATPAGTTVYFEVGPEHASVISNPDGSFNLELSKADLNSTYGEFNFTMPDKKNAIQRYELKNISEALSLVADTALDAPAEISFVNIHNNEVLILSEQAALLRRIKINGDWTIDLSSQQNILLNPKILNNPSPQIVDASKNHAVATLFNSGELSLIDLKANKLINNFKLPNNQTNSAQRVMALDDVNYLVSFVNFSFTKDSFNFGPGVLALIEIKDDSINLKQTLNLPCKNPYDFKFENSKELWVSCRGVETQVEKQKKISDAAMIKLSLAPDMKSMAIKTTKILDNFAPGEFAVINDTVVVPELWGNRLLVLKEKSVNIEPIEAKYSRKFNFTVASHWHEDIVMLGEASGALVAYSLSENFFPFPFSEPIRITKDPEQQVKFVPNQVIMRHTSSQRDLKQDYPLGYGAWVVLHRQSQIIPLDFLKIFGP